MGRQWAKREAQILAAVDSTVGMVGDPQGIAGKAMPELRGLDMPLLEAWRDPYTSKPNVLFYMTHRVGPQSDTDPLTRFFSIRRDLDVPVPNIIQPLKSLGDYITKGP
jgi:hypothetical protein